MISAASSIALVQLSFKEITKIWGYRRKEKKICETFSDADEALVRDVVVLVTRPKLTDVNEIEEIPQIFPLLQSLL